MFFKPILRNDDLRIAKLLVLFVIVWLLHTIQMPLMRKTFSNQLKAFQNRFVLMAFFCTHTHLYTNKMTHNPQHTSTCARNEHPYTQYSNVYICIIIYICFICKYILWLKIHIMTNCQHIGIHTSTNTQNHYLSHSHSHSLSFSLLLQSLSTPPKNISFACFVRIESERHTRLHTRLGVKHESIFFIFFLNLYEITIFSTFSHKKKSIFFHPATQYVYYPESFKLAQYIFF